MKIIIDLHEQQLSSVVSDGVFYAQTETTIDLATQSGEKGAFNGVSCALLAPDGVTLAHAIASENKAILNTNTEECVKLIEGSSIDSERIAFLAIGDSDKPLAILPVAIKRNPIAEIAPPTELAPTYPTSESLRAILAQMSAQAQRAEDAVEATENAQKAVAQYVDVTFPSKVTEAEKTLENATTSGVNSVTQRANQAIDVLNQKQTAIVANIDTKAQAVNTALDGKLSTAQTAINEAVGKAETAKGDAVKAQGEASKSAEQASTSASNANTSATNAKTSEDNAKSYATQAKNATALKVDQRINTADNSEYPLIVMVDKDVYKFIAPKGATNNARCRYCCDGTGHYFGFLNGDTDGDLYEYDVNLKFARKIRVTFGQWFNFDYQQVLDFCTKLHNVVYKKDEQGNDVIDREYDAYYIRSCSYPYTTQYIRKYDANGTELANCVIVRDEANTRICSNERTNHLLVFTRFTADTTMGEHTVHANKMGYTIYDENLNTLGVRELDCEVPTTNGFNNIGNWLQHLNVVGNTTFISYAPTDTEKTAFYCLDENDDLVGLNLINASTTAPKAIVIRGSGDFVASEKTSTGRTDGKYFVPRMFYDYRNASDSSPYHMIWLTNGAKWVDLRLYHSEERKGEIVALWERFIKTDSIPSSLYDARCIFFANGSGSANGEASYVQNVANLSASGIVTKFYNVYGAVSFTEFAPDPFASLSNFPRVVTGNTHPTSDTTGTPRVYQLYPAGTFGQAGGAIMFTV